jgi:hypothetical protein
MAESSGRVIGPGGKIIACHHTALQMHSSGRTRNVGPAADWPLVTDNKI